MYGISLDDVKSQQAFRREHELAFALLSDPDGSAADKYAVRKGAYASRVTFVIDEQGVLRAIDEKVNVTSHGADVAKLVRELRA